jgi:hypothetical protein
MGALNPDVALVLFHPMFAQKLNELDVRPYDIGPVLRRKDPVDENANRGLGHRVGGTLSGSDLFLLSDAVGVAHGYVTRALSGRILGTEVVIFRYSPHSPRFGSGERILPTPLEGVKKSGRTGLAHTFRCAFSTRLASFADLKLKVCASRDSSPTLRARDSHGHNPSRDA